MQKKKDRFSGEWCSVEDCGRKTFMYVAINKGSDKDNLWSESGWWSSLPSSDIYKYMGLLIPSSGWGELVFPTEDSPFFPALPIP